jgi:hypothetical protein
MAGFLTHRHLWRVLCTVLVVDVAESPSGMDSLAGANWYAVPISYHCLHVAFARGVIMQYDYCIQS